MTLRETIEQTLESTDLMVPQEIAERVLGQVEDYEDALIAHTRTDLPNNDCPVSAQIPPAVVDKDGFCSEHGWDCDDFRTHLDLTDPEGDPT